MKKILLLLAFISFSFVQAQEIKWMSFDEAIALQKENPKPIFMDVYTDWCGPCKMLDKNTFQTKEVSEYINANYYAVKFNGEGNTTLNYKGRKFSNPGYDANRKGRNSMHEFTGFLKVEGYPSMYVLDKTGEIAKVIVGYYQPEQLLSELNGTN
ncbi:thioredoxin family protein [Flavobacterium orientale]|uniref:Thioredoxin n=1 Tax=Flavobacterium orientale TaxID=1756020 RepID=A0A917DAV3_9FLAO|nr:thioredoxin family protein [Flavobacterium orientale]GGD20000.1 thioredoxin [Flavobacterium orientale]